MSVDIITRADKGAPLTSAEMDGNLLALKEAIEGVAGAVPVGFTLDPDDFSVTIEFSNGSESFFVGPLQLPPRQWSFKGDWLAGTYDAADVVKYDGSLYFRAVPGAWADLEDDVDTGNWVLMLAGSSDGGGPAPIIVNAFKPGAISSDSIILLVRPQVALEMTSAFPIKIDLGTAAGSLAGFGIVVSINGVAAPTIPIAGTTTAFSILVDLAIDADDLVRIAITSSGTAGAAADLGITTYWQPVAP